MEAEATFSSSRKWDGAGIKRIKRKKNRDAAPKQRIGEPWGQLIRRKQSRMSQLLLQANVVTCWDWRGLFLYLQQPFRIPDLVLLEISSQAGEWPLKEGGRIDQL